MDERGCYAPLNGFRLWKDLLDHFEELWIGVVDIEYSSGSLAIYRAFAHTFLGGAHDDH